jgi:hypothetical protein
MGTQFFVHTIAIIRQTVALKKTNKIKRQIPVGKPQHFLHRLLN